MNAAYEPSLEITDAVHLFPVNVILLSHAVVDPWIICRLEPVNVQFVIETAVGTVPKGSPSHWTRTP